MKHAALTRFARSSVRLGADIRGNVLALTGAGTFALVGGAGLATDAVQWYMWKRQLHQATDAGALAGAYALSQGAASVDASVQRELDRNSNTAIVLRAVNTPPASGDFTGQASAVEVIATTQRRLPFSSLFLPTPPSIRTRSVAAMVRDGEHCVIALAPDGIGVNLAGTARVELGCGVAANSDGGDAIDLDGGSYLLGSPLTAVGGISSGSSNLARGTQLSPYSVAQQDPLASRDLGVPASPSACAANNLTVQPNRPPVTLSPGRYCGGMTLKGQVTLSPGVYIIDEGSFYLTSQANVTGEGVTIILTGSTPNKIATVKMDGGATANLRAPTPAEDETWHDILFFQDQDAEGQLSSFAGGSSARLKGITYMPGGTLRYTGGSGHEAECLFLIASRVSFTGTTKIRNQCPDEVADQFAAASVRIVE
jgi:hypothetical protein